MTGPHRRNPVRPRSRRSAWALLGLWLLVALLPLRAWAWAEMAVSTGEAPAAVAAAASEPPCHGPSGSGVGEEGSGHAASCALCLFCAPMLVAEGAAPPALLRPQGVPGASPPGHAPEGLPQSLFRPPRDC